MNRLTTANYPWGSFVQYTYDALGNRITEQSDGPPYLYAYDDDNRLMSDSKTGSNYLYDANGNLIIATSFTGFSQYEYDFNNRLVSLQQNSSITTYTYAANGDRISKSDGFNPIYYFYDFEAWWAEYTKPGLFNQLGEYDAIEHRFQIILLARE
ncbi:MAG: hypothetical protein R2750_02335 [Bacteroidales bacterium]